MISVEKINKKIDSTALAGKITFAMMMLAKVKMQKIKSINKKYQSFYSEIESVYLKDILETPTEYFGSPNKPQRILLIFGSDLGLCGPFNNNIMKYVNISVMAPTDKIIIFGQKLYSLSHYINWHSKIISNFDNLEENQHHFSFKQLAWKVTQLLKEHKVTTIDLVYMDMAKSSHQPEVLNIFHIDPTKIQNESPKPNISWIDFFSYALQSAYWYSKLAEYSNRLISMTTANEKAEELLADYKVQYNKIRQNNITQGILEIINATKRQNL